MDGVAQKTHQMEWHKASEYPSGAEIKVLREGGLEEGRTVLLKLPPHYKMDEHSHTSLEQHYVLEGEYESQGQVFSAGSYQLIPQKTTHGPFTSASGAILLVVWDPILAWLCS